MVTIINEVYVGRTKEINDMFLTFSLARKYYMNNKAAKGMKELGKFEKQIEDYFGFGSFSVDIEPDSEMNACTIPVVSSLNIDPSSIIISTPKGYKFNPAANVASISRITRGLFCNPNITDGEAFAIFLHEVGHSFVNRSPAIDAMRDIYVGQVMSSLIMQAILDLITLNPFGLFNDLLQGITLTNFSKIVMSQCAKLQKKIPIYRTLKWHTNRIISAMKNGAVSTLYILSSLTGLPYIANKLNQVTAKQYNSRKVKQNPQAYGRAQERLSDDFANIYGFGPELASGLLKIENRGNSIGWSSNMYKIPIVGSILQLTEDAGLEYMYTFGVHPGASDRILKIMENIEYEINHDKTLKDKDKKALRMQLKEIKKLVSDGKKLEGELAKYPDQTKAAYIKLGLINGSTEDNSEREYTDMKAINTRYKEIKETANSLYYDLDNLNNMENFDEQYDRELKKLYF